MEGKVPGEFIARGAEAKLFKGTLLDREVIVKSRIEKKYRVKQLDEHLRKVRTRNEARIMLRARANELLVPLPYYVSEFDIWMQLIPGKLLRDIKSEKTISKETYKEIGEMLAILHASEITHGDFTPANIMVDDNEKLWIIDFGLSIISNELEEQAIDLLLMEKNIGGDFAHLLEGYKKNENWKKVVDRMQEIKKRGRYFVREKGE